MIIKNFLLTLLICLSYQTTVQEVHPNLTARNWHNVAQSVTTAIPTRVPHMGHYLSNVHISIPRLNTTNFSFHNLHTMMYELGQIVWGKMRGLKPLPGVVVSYSENGEEILINFFAIEQRAWISKADVMPYEAHEHFFTQKITNRLNVGVTQANNAAMANLREHSSASVDAEDIFLQHDVNNPDENSDIPILCDNNSDYSLNDARIDNDEISPCSNESDPVMNCDNELNNPTSLSDRNQSPNNENIYPLITNMGYVQALRNIRGRLPIHSSSVHVCTSNNGRENLAIVKASTGDANDNNKAMHDSTEKTKNCMEYCVNCSKFFLDSFELVVD